jgi:hypothetical protein
MNGSRIVRSTKYEAKSKAISAAKDFYNELLLKKKTGEPLTEGNQPSDASYQFRHHQEPSGVSE